MPTEQLTPSDREALCVAIQEWIAAGYALIPIRPDESKAPAIKSWGAIAGGEEPPPSATDLVAMVRGGRCDGVAAVMGVASGNAEMLELEGRIRHRLPELYESAEAFGIGDLFGRLCQGCTETSPAGGVHFYVRVSDGVVAGNTKLAVRSRRNKDEVLAETRGQGGYSICAPSGGRTHKLNRPYEMLAGSPANTPMVTVEELEQLHRLFRLFDERPAAPLNASPPKEWSEEKSGVGDGLSPGDDFNARMTWEELLEGWIKVHETTDQEGRKIMHWRRPGKDRGVSASVLGDGEWLYNFSSSVPLPTENTLSKFAVFTHLHHDGDFSAAAADLAQRGYGRRTRAQSADTTDVPEYQPLPLDLLPCRVREFVRAAAAETGCDPCFVALPALAALGAAIGNTRRLRLKTTWRVPPIVWTVLVGESGNQKTTGFQLAVGPIQRLQAQALKRYEAEFAEYEGTLRRWEAVARKNRLEKPKPPIAERYVCGDTTVEALAPLLRDNPRGLLLERDELRGWIGSFDRYASGTRSRSDEAHWLSMYNSGAILVDRKSAGGGVIHVPRASICITGGIQPGTLRRALSAEHRESGLAARLLMAYPPRTPKHWTEGAMLPEIADGYANLFPRLLSLQWEERDGERLPIDMGLSEEAKQVYVDFYNSHNQETARHTGDLAAAWSKLEETPARLALVIELVTWAGSGAMRQPEEISLRSMEMAIGLTEWFKNETRRIYALLFTGDADGTPTERERLIQFLRRHGGQATVRQVQAGCSFLKKPGKAEAALEELVTDVLGVWVEQTGGTSGRPKRLFRLVA